MTTFLLILAALLVIALIAATCHQMFTNPFLFVWHLMFDTVGSLIHVLVALLQAIGEGLSDAASGIGGD